MAKDSNQLIWLMMRLTRGLTKIHRYISLILIEFFFHIICVRSKDRGSMEDTSAYYSKKKPMLFKGWSKYFNPTLCHKKFLTDNLTIFNRFSNPKKMFME
jgi:hypothetical protein